jgi:hypothetical protein
MSSLFNNKSEYGHAVIDDRRTHLEARLSEQKALIALPRFSLGALEPRAPRELPRCKAARLVDLRHAEDQAPVIALNEVPGLRHELVLDRVDKTGRPIDIEDLLTPEKEPQQLVEAGEVIHMSMYDKNIADAQELARSKTAEAAKVE